MNINLDLYKVFYYVAKNKNISRAAEELMISQPAVSKSIKTLENQMNIQLFKRTNNGVKLTEIGNIIYKKVENALTLIESVESDVKSRLNIQSGTLTIGVSRAIMDEFLMPHIIDFHNKYPNIKIKLLTDNTDLIKKYQLGLVDVVFTHMPAEIPENCKFIKLTSFHNCFAANEKYINYKNKKLLNKDLEKLPLLLLDKGTINRNRIDEYCYKNKIKLNPEMEFGSNTLIKDFTLTGFGIGMLDEEGIKEELENGKLFKLDIDIPLREKYLGLFYNPNNQNLVLDKFIKLITD